ncbi:MAG: elongation factor Ts [Puniceicoccales bacterium]|jgi:elongation factor Ts|nr:elongation factor Ts [Puniceicoccales bacterium]
MSVLVDAKLVSDLRRQTGAGLVDCKRALTECEGHLEEAVTWLKKKGMASAAKKSGREACQGLVHSYLHFGGKLGVLVEVNCETDFVARNEEFRQLVADLAMHIAASAPLYVSRSEIPEEVVRKEREIAEAQCEGKPAVAVTKIVEGKLSKWYGEVCLMDQAFVKDSRQTVGDLVVAKIAKIGENIVVRRFVRYQIGG